MNERCEIVPSTLLQRLAKIDRLPCPDQSAALQELRELIISPTPLPLDDDLRYILRDSVNWRRNASDEFQCGADVEAPIRPGSHQPGV
ncbi:hypothetical protein [Pseudomonas viridiflava]|uniref:hypothetical protein n=1 Tax=Pseudomonas viridiflava TaxID=33069 RepID=UPI00041CE3C5|nr:hypothetical protein [Pseudomonas viridiflava]